MRKEAVVLFSGGLDSSTLLYEMARAGFRIIALSFDYGQRHAYRELQAAKTVFAFMKDNYPADHEHHILTVDYGKVMQGNALTDRGVDVPLDAYTPGTIATTVVPGRNATFLTIAYGVSQSRGINTIATAIHGGDHEVYRDCRPAFVHNMEMVFNYLSAADKTMIHTPYIRMDKRAIARRAYDYGVPITSTYSCYNGGPYECGQCATCRERRDALEFAYRAYLEGHDTP
jgi:7-cyano-7-deazaguanine synthase